MKLLVFTPVVVQSAIGRMAAMVHHSLIEAGHEVRVVRTELDHGDGETQHMAADIIDWRDDAAVVEAIGGADVVVYHIGNHYDFHAGALRWMEVHRGVVCLHDYFVGSLFLSWCHAGQIDPHAAVSAVYGDDAADLFVERMSRGDISEDLVETAPMTEWICAMSAGVVVHSDWMIGRVERSAPGPVGVIPLAYDAPGSRTPDTSSDGDPRVTIVTVGNVNANKRVGSVIAAIGSSNELRRSVEYRVIGKVEPSVLLELSALARQHRVQLVMAGEVDAAVLADSFASADIVVAVRHPNLESASATAIEAMLVGKALVVSSTGPTRAIPDECTMKVDMRDEIPEIRSRLETLVRDPGGRARMGANAQEYATSVHSADRYARDLVELARSAVDVVPVLEVLDDAAGQMAAWHADLAGLGAEVSARIVDLWSERPIK